MREYTGEGKSKDDEAARVAGVCASSLDDSLEEPNEPEKKGALMPTAEACSLNVGSVKAELTCVSVFVRASWPSPSNGARVLTAASLAMSVMDELEDDGTMYSDIEPLREPRDLLVSTAGSVNVNLLPCFSPVLDLCGVCVCVSECVYVCMCVCV